MLMYNFRLLFVLSMVLSMVIKSATVAVAALTAKIVTSNTKPMIFADMTIIATDEVNNFHMFTKVQLP